MEIRTNNVPRNLIHGYDLAPRWRAEFDHLDEDQYGECTFVMFKGRPYDTHEFMRIDRTVAPHAQRPDWEKWDGYLSDSHFSGLLIRFVDNGERVVVAQYFA